MAKKRRKRKRDATAVSHYLAVATTAPLAGLEPPPSKGVHLSRKRSTTTPRGQINLCNVQSAGAVHEPVFLIRPPKKAGSLRRHGRHDARTEEEGEHEDVQIRFLLLKI